MLVELQNGQHMHSPSELDKSYTLHQELKDFAEVEIDEGLKLNR